MFSSLLGAIEAIEAAGKVPGEDIKIVTIDAVKDGMTALAEGKINYIVECNPLLGPQFYEVALKAVNGESMPKWIPSKEGIFLPETAAKDLPNRKY